MRLFNNSLNVEAAVMLLIKSSGNYADREQVTAELDKHPDYPSLLAISDVLTHFKITNQAYQVETNQVTEVPCPFVAYTNMMQSDFVVVNKIDNDLVYLSNEKWNNHCISLNKFKELFNGVVLTVQRAYLSAPQQQTVQPISRYREPALITGLIFVFSCLLLSNTAYLSALNLSIVSLALWKTIGLIISILLLVQSIDHHNPLVQRLCKTAGKTDCNAILSSKAAKVTSWLSWSEIGFFYFAGTWLLLFSGGSSSFVMRVLLVLNLFGLPYTFYSIYYQARVVKRWCTLCCAVQAILWLEAGSLWLFNTNGFHQRLWPAAFSTTDLRTIATIACYLLLPALLWLFIKPFVLQLKQLPSLKQQLRRFKYNAGLFQTFLKSQPRCDTPDERWSIVLGNLEADNVVTMVSNPYCQPCAKMHQALEKWLTDNDNIQARIVFTANNTEEDRKTTVTRHLMALNELPDKAIVRRALHDWYEQKYKNYDGWAKAYPVQLEATEYYKLDKQHDWCKLAEVTATPTMLLNGYRLPDVYQIPDLTYMLQ